MAPHRPTTWSHFLAHNAVSAPPCLEAGCGVLCVENAGARWVGRAEEEVNGMAALCEPGQVCQSRLGELPGTLPFLWTEWTFSVLLLWGTVCSGAGFALTPPSLLWRKRSINSYLCMGDFLVFFGKECLQTCTKIVKPGRLFRAFVFLLCQEKTD